jgi:hypothetical protein
MSFEWIETTAWTLGLQQRSGDQHSRCPCYERAQSQPPLEKCETRNRKTKIEKSISVMVTLTVQLASTKRFSAFKSRCNIGGDALRMMSQMNSM